MTQPITTTISPVAASGPGALAGFAIDCSACGRVAAYSLETMSVSEARSHERWHITRAPRRAR